MKKKVQILYLSKSQLIPHCKNTKFQLKVLHGVWYLSKSSKVRLGNVLKVLGLKVKLNFLNIYFKAKAAYLSKLLPINSLLTHSTYLNIMFDGLI